MNWLNAVDNILDGAFSGGGQETDDETASNYGSSVTSTEHMNEVVNWSEEEEDEEEQHPRLAFSMLGDAIREEDETVLAEEDDEKAQKRPQARTSRAATPGKSNMIRPGNIRVMHRAISSSSEDEQSDDGKEQTTVNKQDADKKPEPITLSQQDSYLIRKEGSGGQTIQGQSAQDTPTVREEMPRKSLQTAFIKQSIGDSVLGNSPQKKNSARINQDSSTDLLPEESTSQPASPVKANYDLPHDTSADTPLQNNKQSAKLDGEAVSSYQIPMPTSSQDADDSMDEDVRTITGELEKLRAMVEEVTWQEDEENKNIKSQRNEDAKIENSDFNHAKLSPEETQSSERKAAGDRLRDIHLRESENGSFEETTANVSLKEEDMQTSIGEVKHSIEAGLIPDSEAQVFADPSASHDTGAIGDGKQDTKALQEAVAVTHPATEKNSMPPIETEEDDSVGLSFGGVRHSETTFPVANFRDSISESLHSEESEMNDEDEEEDSDDRSIHVNGVSESNCRGGFMEEETGGDNEDIRMLSSPSADTDAPPRTTDKTSSSKHDLVRSSSPFELKKASTLWEEDLTYTDIDPTEINCYGAFHIRVLRAQRLPCPVGSTVQASVSLLPWKGQFRSERRVTFVLDHGSSSPSMDHGVCAQWDDKKGDPSITISLIHAYVNDTTPLPTMKINLLVSPVKMFEFSMCSLSLPCDALMKLPGKWKRQWFVAEMQENRNEGKDQLFNDNQTSLIEVEAMFVPDDQSLSSSFVSIGQSQQVHAQEEDFNDDDSDKFDTPFESAGPNADVGSRDVGDNLVNPTKPHLMRAHKFWKPASCALCSKSLMGWKRRSFRCEACGLDCCSDCRLHVDLQLPCGSEKAALVVSKLIQNRLTVTSFLETMAPVDESYEQKKRELNVGGSDGETSLTDTRSLGGTTHTTRGERGRIGVMKMNISRACVFDATLPAVTEPVELLKRKGGLRPGDYYVRVCRTGIEGSARTRTIPSAGVLKFESNEMRLDVPHYGIDFVIEVVDALTDKAVGTSVITTQGILQQQRDLMIERGAISIFTVGKKPPVFKGKERMVLELRTGVKSGVSSDFFVPVDSKSDQGEISGWVEITAGLEEDVKRLYGSAPYECPPRPPDELNLNLLNLHISRISDFLEDVGNLFSIYQHIVSWKNPILTGFSFIVFVSLTLRFNAEYVGSLPFLFLMICMLPLAASRSVGTSKDRFVLEEAEEWTAAEKDINVNYTIHRPVGTVNVDIMKGRNIRSRELGLAGNVGCRVYWDPTRYSSGKQKEKIIALDKSTATHHDIGSTDSKFTTNPTWDKFNESDESRRLKQILPHHGNFFEMEEETAKEKGIEFPILQPFRRLDEEEADENSEHVNIVLEPWKASSGGIVFQIHFRDILNMLPGSDHIFGEVSIPLSTLVEKKELSGWFQVLEVGSKQFLISDHTFGAGVPEIIEETPVVNGLADAASSAAGNPEIFLSIKWSPPDAVTDSMGAEETQREASFVIQEELLRWAAVNRDKDKLKQLVVGGSIGAFKRVSGLAGTLQVIQNFLGKVANSVEGARNLLNFTDPYKSSMLLAAVTSLWLVLCILPTRIIILVAGLTHYGLTLKKRLQKVLKPGTELETQNDDTDDTSQASDLDADEESDDAVIVWLKNAFRGLPTDEDLRKTYFWEGRRTGAKKRDKYTNEKRLARLKRLWRAQWHATIKMRDVKSKGNSKGSLWIWRTVFAIVQGRRFLWWNTTKDFDSGQAPIGRIFLAGHAGLSGLSPLEMREIDPKDVSFVVGIFGRGLTDQQRVTLLLPNEELKESLENVVIEASVGKQD